VIATPRRAMVLAAGRGMRLRPVTETLPKPLVELNGRTLLDHAIDRLAAVGVNQVIVNVHYMAAKIVAQLARRDTPPDIEIIEEAELLETGGGVANALCSLGEMFFVINADVFWLDGKDSTLLRLTRAFDPERMDAVLLLARTASAVGYDGDGDYLLDPAGTPRRRHEREIAPFLFAGIQLLHRRLFDDWPQRVFSSVRLFDRAEEAGRLHAIVHDGEWYHIGTPAGLGATRERLNSHRVER
jgi:N-acetyl-alpha-D-muramate 1-phosphate uridylyltransferase